MMFRAIVIPAMLLMLSYIGHVSVGQPPEQQTNWRANVTFWLGIDECFKKILFEAFKNDPIGNSAAITVYITERTSLYTGVPANFTTCQDFEYLANRVIGTAQRHRSLQGEGQQEKVKNAVNQLVPECVHCGSSSDSTSSPNNGISSTTPASTQTTSGSTQATSASTEATTSGGESTSNSTNSTQT